MIIFDTETTGLPRANIVPLNKQPKIIEFAAIKICDRTLNEIDRIEFKCNPKESLSKRITQITGLTDLDLIQQPAFDRFFPQLVEFFFGEKYLVAHNLAFDIRLLSYELRRLRKLTAFPFPPIQICTVVQTFKLNGYRLSLTKMYNHLFGVDFEEAHRAMIDVQALTKCVKELIQRGVIKL